MKKVFMIFAIMVITILGNTSVGNCKSVIIDMDKTKPSKAVKMLENKTSRDILGFSVKAGNQKEAYKKMMKWFEAFRKDKGNKYGIYPIYMSPCMERALEKKNDSYVFGGEYEKHAIEKDLHFYDICNYHYMNQIVKEALKDAKTENEMFVMRTLQGSKYLSGKIDGTITTDTTTDTIHRIATDNDIIEFLDNWKNVNFKTASESVRFEILARYFENYAEYKMHGIPEMSIESLAKGKPQIGNCGDLAYMSDVLYRFISSKNRGGVIGAHGHDIFVGKFERSDRKFDYFVSDNSVVNESNNSIVNFVKKGYLREDIIDNYRDYVKEFDLNIPTTEYHEIIIDSFFNSLTDERIEEMIEYDIKRTYKGKNTEVNYNIKVEGKTFKGTCTVGEKPIITYEEEDDDEYYDWDDDFSEIEEGYYENEEGYGYEVVRDEEGNFIFIFDNDIEYLE